MTREPFFRTHFFFKKIGFSPAGWISDPIVRFVDFSSEVMFFIVGPFQVILYV